MKSQSLKFISSPLKITNTLGKQKWSDLVFLLLLLFNLMENHIESGRKSVL